jgi:hypothetical protein
MTHSKESPANDTHQNGNSCLVDFCDALYGYEEIANDESGNDDSNC